MKRERYSIIYSSKTGNTKKLAEAIYNTLPQNKCDYYGTVDKIDDVLSNVIYTEDKLEISNKLLKEILSKKYYKTIVMVDSWLANAGEVIAQTGYDDINILGFDLMPQNKEALKQGKVTYIIDQSTYMQSYECVHKVCEHLIYGTELPKGKNYLPIHIYNKYNLD